MAVGGKTSQPIGHHEFCVAHPAECSVHSETRVHVRLDRARWKDAYLCRTLAEAGAPVAFASDWPVADVSILRGLKAARVREPYPGGADERLDLMTCLQAYTAGGAWAAHREHVTGTLRPGLAGDVVVLSCDVEAVAAADLDRHRVALTVCGGKITHRSGI